MLPTVVLSTENDPNGPVSNRHWVPRGLKGGKNAENCPSAVVQQNADVAPEVLQCAKNN
jgi:hypothetical protein